MKLTEIFNLKNAAEMKNGEALESSALVREENAVKLNRQIKALVPGQTILGEVISKSGNEIQIQLAEDMVLSARVERDFVLDIGKIMIFQVKNNGSSLVLSPLFENTATDANVFKALEMAGLPFSEKSIGMTEEMMRQGMPVDRTSLQTMFKEVSANPGATLSNVIQLHQLKLAVTPENLAMMEQYNGMSHQLTAGISKVTGEISDLFQNLLQEGNLEAAIKLYMDLSMTLTQEGASPKNPREQNAMAPEAESGTLVLSESLSMEQSEEAGIKNLLLQILSREELEEFTGQLARLNEKQPSEEVEQLLEDIQKGNASARDVLQVISGKGLYSGVDITQNIELSNLLSGKEYTKILKAEIMSQWLLEPEEVKDAQNVASLYQRLGKQLEGIREAISRAASDLTTESTAVNGAMKSVVNMQNNLDFMNHINQVYHYIQLPLKLQGKEAHGELYVYTNKRNLARKEGSISALLHLDMEHLGPVDVYMTMQNQRIGTKFYLREESMIDFIQEHIHILNERLEQKGYLMNHEVLHRGRGESEKSFLEKAKGEERNVNLLARYAFDVRA